MSDQLNHHSPDTLKTCCAALYESEWARWLLGNSFHPGGLALTERVGELLRLDANDHVLDVASGQGQSALCLAERFGCQVTGVDYGATAVSHANDAARAAGLDDRVRFYEGDAEQLPFANGRFDAIMCECALCTFPDKPTAVSEFARVLRENGRVGLSDLTRNGTLPPELDGLLAWIACIADAQPGEQYRAYLEESAFVVTTIERHDHALAELVRRVQGKLLSAELMLKLKQIDLPTLDLTPAKSLARHAAEAVRAGKLGYALFIGQKQSSHEPKRITP